MYKIAVFDMDGTLIDTLEDLRAAANYALTASGFPERSREEFRQCIGNGQRMLVRQCLPEHARDDGTVQRVIDIYAPYYAAHAAERTVVYGGIAEAIEKMREAGMKIAVLSNKPHAPTVELAETFFPGMIDAAFGQRDHVPHKPDPAGLLMILDGFGLSKEECIYIGDSDVDMQTAINAGVDAIGVAWGYCTRDEIKNAGGRVIISETSQLAPLVLGKRELSASATY